MSTVIQVTVRNTHLLRTELLAIGDVGIVGEIEGTQKACALTMYIVALQSSMYSESISRNIKSMQPGLTWH